MATEKANPITGHEVTIMPPTATQLKPFGWIRLLNHSQDAGYVYLDSQTSTDPHLGGDGSYVVTAMPFEALQTLLDVLRNEGRLQIRFFDPEAAGISPSVFIEPLVSTFSSKNVFHVPEGVAAEIHKVVAEGRARCQQRD